MVTLLLFGLGGLNATLIRSSQLLLLDLAAIMTDRDTSEKGCHSDEATSMPIPASIQHKHYLCWNLRANDQLYPEPQNQIRTDKNSCARDDSLRQPVPALESIGDIRQWQRHQSAKPDHSSDCAQ